MLYIHATREISNAACSYECEKLRYGGFKMGGRGPSATPSKGRFSFFPEVRGASDPCDLTMRTFLSNVRRAASTELRPGHPLLVRIETVGTRRTLVCTRPDGVLIGTILSRGAAEIIDCIDQGYSYSARIIQIDEGLVEVMIGSAP
jgi:hypothetical protein